MVIELSPNQMLLKMTKIWMKTQKKGTMPTTRAVNTGWKQHFCLGISRGIRLVLTGCSITYKEGKYCAIPHV